MTVTINLDCQPEWVLELLRMVFLERFNCGRTVSLNVGGALFWVLVLHKEK